MSHAEALIHISRAEREVSRIPGTSDSTPIKRIDKAAVVGCGNMGAGIAMAFANAGIPVYAKEASREFLDKACARIRKSYESSQKKGRMTQEQVHQRIALIMPTVSYDVFADADVVVEAVDENMPLKKQIFGELDAVCKPETILATNTSSLDIDEIASATSIPARVVGWHFFAPANVMPLIEIVRGKATSVDVIASSMAMAGRLKKTGVVVGNCRGFAGNRMYYKYQREAQFLVEEGAGVQEVDAALRDFGMAMGPFATRDLSGLDVAWRIQNELGEVEPPDRRRPLVMDILCKTGRFGQKTGAGWYRYLRGDRTPLPDPEVEKIIKECAERAGIMQRSISPEEIIERTIYALVNEGAHILEEGIASSAMALDVIFIKGYGFPASRGGPMWFADNVGLATVCARICEFESQHGAHWTPALLLKHLAERHRSFMHFDDPPVVRKASHDPADNSR